MVQGTVISNAVNRGTPLRLQCASETIGGLIEDELSEYELNLDKYVATLNGSPAGEDTALTPGFTLVLTPRNIDGSC